MDSKVYSTERVELAVRLEIISEMFKSAAALLRFRRDAEFESQLTESLVQLDAAMNLKASLAQVNP